MATVASSVFEEPGEHFRQIDAENVQSSRVTGVFRRGGADEAAHRFRRGVICQRSHPNPEGETPGLRPIMFFVRVHQTERILSFGKDLSTPPEAPKEEFDQGEAADEQSVSKSALLEMRRDFS